ncbi:hypothetical protein NLI96_g7391 [Meripilus lineatus]|uniref:Uncharacterized protein n=1 Tax=Meripilus lineatus TaxID=2056292 RepID=A0AAD5V441_9APHY|nr:hypothetical protein NLI96_g7391 [Physisporinus lineatus]
MRVDETNATEQPETVECIAGEEANEVTLSEKSPGMAPPSYKQGPAVGDIEMVQDTVRSQGSHTPSLKAGEGSQVVKQKCRDVNINLLKSTRQQHRLVQGEGCRDGCQRNRIVKKRKGDWKRRRKKGMQGVTRSVSSEKRRKIAPRALAGTVTRIGPEGNVVVLRETGCQTFRIDVIVKVSLLLQYSWGGPVPRNPNDLGSEMMKLERIFQDSSLLLTARALERCPSDATTKNSALTWYQKTAITAKAAFPSSHGVPHVVQESQLRSHC